MRKLLTLQPSVWGSTGIASGIQTPSNHKLDDLQTRCDVVSVAFRYASILWHHRVQIDTSQASLSFAFPRASFLLSLSQFPTWVTCVDSPTPPLAEAKS